MTLIEIKANKSVRNKKNKAYIRLEKLMAI